MANNANNKIKSVNKVFLKQFRKLVEKFQKNFQSFEMVNFGFRFLEVKRFTKPKNFSNLEIVLWTTWNWLEGDNSTRFCTILDWCLLIGRVFRTKWRRVTIADRRKHKLGIGCRRRQKFPIDNNSSLGPFQELPNTHHGNRFFSLSNL